jgi:aminoglycoside 3-N-acetyltransferase
MEEIKDVLRPVYREAKAYADRVHRFIDRRTISEDEFRQLIARLGIVPGATIFIHSSMDEIARRAPHLTAVRVIQILQDALTDAGTLLLPTFPFQGKQFDYVRRHPTFDVKRTPSQVGLMTEVFRRMPGVVRSLHPTHPVAAWGRNAVELTSTHHLGPTFGDTSPFCKLQAFEGRIIGIGTQLESYTILHVADELHPIRRTQVFASPHVTMITNGKEQIEYNVCPLRRDASRRMARVERALRERGALTYISAGGLRCSTAEAGAFIRASLELVDKGLFL